MTPSGKNSGPRGLSQDFIDDMKRPDGRLFPLLQRLQSDDTLDLQIRGTYINVYYRGGSLLRLEPKRYGYKPIFNGKYCNRGNAEPAPQPQIPERIESVEHCQELLDAFPAIKGAMDGWFSLHPKIEREFQQVIVRDNNIGRMGEETDYFIADIEYTFKRPDLGVDYRFDMIGVHWPKTRQKSGRRRLSIMEFKYGDGAIGSSPGRSTKASLLQHLKDIDRFLGVPGALDALKAEVKTVLSQQREIGLIHTRDTDPPLDSFQERPEVLILLANHRPASAILRRELQAVASHSFQNLTLEDIRFVTSNFMGYGLFEAGHRSLDQMLAWKNERV